MVVQRARRTGIAVVELDFDGLGGRHRVVVVAIRIGQVAQHGIDRGAGRLVVEGDDQLSCQGTVVGELGHHDRVEGDVGAAVEQHNAGARQGIATTNADTIAGIQYVEIFGIQRGLIANHQACAVEGGLVAHREVDIGDGGQC